MSPHAFLGDGTSLRIVRTKQCSRCLSPVHRRELPTYVMYILNPRVHSEATAGRKLMCGVSGEVHTANAHALCHKCVHLPSRRREHLRVRVRLMLSKSIRRVGVQPHCRSRLEFWVKFPFEVRVRGLRLVQVFLVLSELELGWSSRSDETRQRIVRGTVMIWWAARLDGKRLANAFLDQMGAAPSVEGIPILETREKGKLGHPLAASEIMAHEHTDDLKKDTWGRGEGGCRGGGDRRVQGRDRGGQGRDRGGCKVWIGGARGRRGTSPNTKVKRRTLAV